MDSRTNDPASAANGTGKDKKKKKKKSALKKALRKEHKATKLAMKAIAAELRNEDAKLNAKTAKQAVGAAAPAPEPAVKAKPEPAPAAPPPPSAPPITPSGAAPGLDFEKLAANLATYFSQSTRMASVSMLPFQTQPGPDGSSELGTVFKTLARVAEHWMSDSTKTLEAQSAIMQDFANLWTQTMRRFGGLAEPPLVPPDPADKRFASAAWKESPLFDFFRQAHALTSKWADDLASRAESLDPHEREKARFYLRQISSALAPSNFLATNPELLRETFASNAENLARGMALLNEDIAAGKGTLKIRQTDLSQFKLGTNMAATPGKVVFRNDLIELIQYAPTTETVTKRPLLIVPPWINKFYILDLNPDKSFVRWAVSQGQTVFMISWVNAEEKHRDKDWAAYMREGIFAALDAIEQATGERDVNAIGYCVGGTLLSATLAYMAETQDERIKSATLFAAQTDFSESGDLKVFIDEAQITALEAAMNMTGYLDGSKMASAFNMLRPNDLIWSYVVNNYLKGQQPPAFDLLAWNSDSTRIPAANHSFYLRSCYLDNKLAKGEMVIDGKTLSLGKIKIPIYSLATAEDHIAPAKSVFIGAKCFGGDVRYVLAGSGHIAGVINSPAKPKYQYWTGGELAGGLEDWRKTAKEFPGSWWPDWIDWLTALAPEKVPARRPGDGKLQPLCDAPGDYVRVIC